MFGYDIYDSTVLVPIPTDSIVCQAFEDAAGKQPVGNPFTKTPYSAFGTQRFSKTPVNIGSILCSDAAAVKAYVHARPADGIPIVQAVARPYVGVLLTAVLEAGLDTSRYILVDNSVAPFMLPNNETYAYIFATYGDEAAGASCQLYENKKGLKKIGKRITVKETFWTVDKNYIASKVKAIRCKQYVHTCSNHVLSNTTLPIFR